MLENNIYSESKALFLQELEAGNVPEDAVAYIEDTKEIYTHGTYFASGDGYVSQADFNSTYGIIQESFNAKQNLLKSGENIKTINGESLLGEGDIVINTNTTDLSNYYTKEEIDNIIEQSGGVSITKTPIIRTTINNENCYVDVDTKTYITCEGSTNIFLNQYEDDGYVHSYEIILLIGESTYSISFPNNIKWIKPLTITKNTRYNIIIEDNIATWVSIQN